jgi:sugar O-acyltransferase (sialic acid O-acetyltransferase NeuD family)
VKLAIYGAGGHGRVVADAADLSGIWSEINFFDDAYPDFKCSGRWPVIGRLVDLMSIVSTYDGIVVAVGMCDERLRLLELIQAGGGNIVSVIHPSAVIASDCSLGDGVVVCALSVINTGSSIGNGVIINTSATIDHDTHLADGVHVSPGAHLAGGVTVGLSSWIGIGAIIKQQVIIGDQVVVGAGAVVLKNIRSGLTVVGVPSTPIYNGLE